MNVVTDTVAGTRVNDFVIKIGTVNGTGSASANTLLMKTVFRMGVPVVGKNLFPSNIQGLPTWYEIRVTTDGYQARTGAVDLAVAMNADTYDQDLAKTAPGGYLLYDNSWPRPELLTRDDVNVIGVPLSSMINERFDKARTRVLMKNMAYVGAVAALIELDMDIIRALVTETFSSKQHLIDANMDAIDLGYRYVLDNFSCPLPIRVEHMDKTDGYIMMDGNTAAGLGCVYAGATFGAWYPITPSTSLMDGYKMFCERYRVDPETGEHNFCIIQAEDELASIGMVIGAAWNGARAFTPTSGPGISLMSEFIGFAYYGEVPAVLFDVQRTGPSTGLPTRTQQSDILLCAYASHGDTKHIVLFPADPKECFEMAVEAFELAEWFQTPVFVVSDIDIGMNDWMVPKLEWDDNWKPNRGKVLDAEQLENIDKFYRYLDVDGDGVPYRTLPGEHPKGAYFTRGSGHDKFGLYTENSDKYQEVLDRIATKVESAKTRVPAPVFRKASKKTRWGVISVGSSDGATVEALDRLAAEDIPVDYMRIRGFPFAQEVDDFIAQHDAVFIVEQNRDAQLRSLILNETSAEKAKLKSVLWYNGKIPDCRFVVNGIKAHIAEEENK